MTKTITANIISDFFIQKSIEVDIPSGGNISHIKLQKLITYSYVWYLGLRGTKLFDEGVKTCNLGYFVSSQRERFKPFRFMPIIVPDCDFGYMPILLPDFDSDIKSKLDKNIYNFLENIWNVYGIFQGFYLSELQCRENPYIDSSLLAGFCIDVDDGLIKRFYSYDNEKIGNYLPEKSVLAINGDGLYEIVRFVAFDNIDCDD